MFPSFVFVLKYKAEAFILYVLSCTAINRYLLVLHVHRMTFRVTKPTQTSEASNLSGQVWTLNLCSERFNELKEKLLGLIDNFTLSLHVICFYWVLQFIPSGRTFRNFFAVMTLSCTESALRLKHKSFFPLLVHCWRTKLGSLAGFQRGLRP